MFKHKNTNTNTNLLLVDLQDYMFTSKNINRFTKHIIIFNNENIIPKSSLKNIETNKETIKETIKETNKETNKETKK
jgi:glycine/serine hydroxymethyltransferase